MKNLFHEFKHFKGQPVKIFTDDGRAICGIDLEAFEDAVRVIDDCGRLILVEYRHIDAVVEPQMRLRRRCKDKCECHEKEHERDNNENECDEDDFENGEY